MIHTARAEDGAVLEVAESVWPAGRILVIDDYEIEADAEQPPALPRSKPVTDMAPLSHAHADTVRNHWWWRPGWREGRRFYSWHLTFEHAPELHALVDAYQRQLAALPGLDLIPREWLHLTMQGVGFTDEVSDADLARLVHAAQRRLAGLPSIDLAFQRALIRPEAVVLATTPAESVIGIRDAIRGAFPDAQLGNAPERRDGFLPHVSVAYINQDGPAAPISAALEQVDARPATATIHAASLIVLDRDSRLYRWRDHALAQLGSPGATSA